MEGLVSWAVEILASLLPRFTLLVTIGVVIALIVVSRHFEKDIDDAIDRIGNVTINLACVTQKVDDIEKRLNKRDDEVDKRLNKLEDEVDKLLDKLEDYIISLLMTQQRGNSSQPAQQAGDARSASLLNQVIINNEMLSVRGALQTKTVDAPPYNDLPARGQDCPNGNDERSGICK